MECRFSAGIQEDSQDSNPFSDNNAAPAQNEWFSLMNIQVEPVSLAKCGRSSSSILSRYSEFSSHNTSPNGYMTELSPLLFPISARFECENSRDYTRPFLLPFESSGIWEILEKARKTRLSLGSSSPYLSRFYESQLANADDDQKLWEKIEKAASTLFTDLKSGRLSMSTRTLVEETAACISAQSASACQQLTSLHHPTLLYLFCEIELKIDQRLANVVVGRCPATAYNYIHRALVNLPPTKSQAPQLSQPRRMLNRALKSFRPTSSIRKDLYEPQIRHLFNRLLLSMDREDNKQLSALFAQLQQLPRWWGSSQWPVCGKSRRPVAQLNTKAVYLDLIFHTVAIENYPTSVEEVHHTLKDGLASLFPPLRHPEGGEEGAEQGGENEAVIIGSARAFYHLLTLPSDTQLSLALLHQLHSLILPPKSPSSRHSGRFKYSGYGGLDDQEEEGDLEALFTAHTEEFLHWYNEKGWPKVAAEETDALTVAAISHYFLVLLHPYIDGNGRISRYIMNYTLMRAGWPPIVISEAKKDAYIDALDEAQLGNLRPFVRFLCQQLSETIRKLMLSPETKSGFDSNTRSTTLPSSQYGEASNLQEHSHNGLLAPAMVGSLSSNASIGQRMSLDGVYHGMSERGNWWFDWFALFKATIEDMTPPDWEDPRPSATA